MSTGVIIAIGAVVGSLLILGAVYVVVIRMLQRQLEKTGEQWASQGLTIVKGPDMGNYRGHLSVRIPVRGNGVLALTTDDVRFELFAPRREFTVPLADISRVVVRRTWQGSYKAGMRVVGIHYRDTSVEGNEDALGIGVRDAPGWARAIGQTANVPFEEV
jgi:hypothetical protein